MDLYSVMRLYRSDYLIWLLMACHLSFVSHLVYIKYAHNYYYSEALLIRPMCVYVCVYGIMYFVFAADLMQHYK